MNICGLFYILEPNNQRRSAGFRSKFFYSSGGKAVARSHCHNVFLMNCISRGTENSKVFLPGSWCWKKVFFVEWVALLPGEQLQREPAGGNVCLCLHRNAPVTTSWAA